MAQVTKIWWSGFDPVSGNTAFISYTYDDVVLRVQSFTFSNPTSKTIIYSVTSTSNGRNYNGTIPPNTAETTITINTGQAQNRLQLILLPNGKLDGLERNIDFG